MPSISLFNVLDARVQLWELGYRYYVITWCYLLYAYEYTFPVELYILSRRVSKLLTCRCLNYYEFEVHVYNILHAWIIYTTSRGGSAKFVIRLLVVLCFSLSWRLKSEKKGIFLLYYIILRQNVMWIDVNVSIESHFDSNWNLIIASKRIANFHEQLTRFIQFVIIFSRHLLDHNCLCDSILKYTPLHTFSDPAPHVDANWDLLIASKRMANFHEQLTRFNRFAILFEAFIRP